MSEFFLRDFPKAKAPVKEKVCTNCKELKDIECFSRAGVRRHAKCKDCMNEMSRKLAAKKKKERKEFEKKLLESKFTR